MCTAVFSLVAVLLVCWLSDNTLEKKVVFSSIPFSWTWTPVGRQHEDSCSEVAFDLQGKALEGLFCLSSSIVLQLVLLPASFGNGLGGPKGERAGRRKEN